MKLLGNNQLKKTGMDFGFTEGGVIRLCRSVRLLFQAGAIIRVACSLLLSSSYGQASAWQFTNVTSAAGANVSHSNSSYLTAPEKNTGGAACGDYDKDGWLDIYHIGGNLGQNHLLHNNGDGTFTDVAGAAGVANPGSLGTGATFADWNGDGWLDLFVGGIEGTLLKLYQNNQDGTFTDVTAASGVWITSDTYSATFGDYDNDRDLDMFLPHWNIPKGPGHVWRNEGNAFTEVDSLVGYLGFMSGTNDYTFAFNLADINSDGWMDMVVASDFQTSHVYMNDGDGTFTNVTDTSVITDDAGMGSSVADYDKDGDLDWFVTSIYDGTPNRDGNRMYRNDGGVFADATDAAGVRDGQWGWGATFQDFNNDGWLDIYHVNGWALTPFWTDPARMFVSNSDGTFTEMAASLGVDHTGQGRGVVAFDYDRDGDVDIFVTVMSGQAVLYRNDGGNANNWLDVKLLGPQPNTEEIGARITATVGGSSQLWELRCGNNYDSQDPAEAHFGLGSAGAVDELRVEWTDSQVTTLTNVAANQRLVIDRQAVSSVAEPRLGGEIMLFGAAPNPFRDNTLIRFALSRDSRAQLRIYDAAGRAVRTVTNRILPAGNHELSWDGLDDSRHPVASGVYYYGIRAGHHRAQGRVILLR